MELKEQIIKDLQQEGSLTWFDLVKRYPAHDLNNIMDGLLDTNIVYSEKSSAADGLRRYFLMADRIEPAVEFDAFIPMSIMNTFNQLFPVGGKA